MIPEYLKLMVLYEESMLLIFPLTMIHWMVEQCLGKMTF